ncbi:MAG: calcium/sodium antiporter [Paludibacteraceae bacterium]|nr:calcium/sodium antiporter [Paludibacteraceae bacterium]
MASSYLSNPILLGLFLVVGLVLLVKGADWLVDGASKLAKRLGVTDLVIGLTIVAFGTSMPEFVVNMVSVADGATDLAITNILGSNIINTLVILGCSALVCPLVAQRSTVRLDIPLNILAGLLVLVFVFISSPMEPKGLSRIEGLALLVVFAAFLVYTFYTVKADATTTTESTPFPLWKCVVLILAGLVCLVVGGEMIVKSAVAIARYCGVAESVIGLTIVALGTSLPELATSVMAAFKHNNDIAIGNVVGSNIFNVFFILGTSAIIKHLPVYPGIEIDAALVAVSALAVWLLLCNKNRSINRWGGALLLVIYAGYLTYRLLTY